jgi:hypothetical protein
LSLSTKVRIITTEQEQEEEELNTTTTKRLTMQIHQPNT